MSIEWFRLFCFYMRKTFLLLLLLFASISVGAQIFSKKAFIAANGKWSIGIGGGITDDEDGERNGAVAGNLIIKGFYIDALGYGWGNDHKHDVEVKKWSGKVNIAWHIGYQIPIIKEFRVIPIVGTHRISRSVTDGSDWTVKDSKIINASYETSRQTKFDYGGVAVINIKRINIYVGYTRACLYGIIGYQF